MNSLANSLKNNQLKAVSLFFLMFSLSACADFFKRPNSPQQQTNSAHNTSLASALVLPELFTEFADPFYCLPSQGAPQLAEADPVPHYNLWAHISAGKKIPFEENARISKQFAKYKRNPYFMQQISQRAEYWLYHIVNELEARDMPLELALLPIVESAYDPFAYSHGQAAGLWQFIPATAKGMGLEKNWWYDGRRDVLAATDAALDYLQTLNKRFDGDWLLTLAAYNSGRATVNRAIRKNRKKNLPTDYWSLKLPKETTTYVPRLLALAKLLDDSEYQARLATDFMVANQPHFSVIDVEDQLDLAQAAKLAGISIDDIYRLNPGYNRWATPPNGPHRLVIPRENSQRFKEALAELPAQHRVKWQRYTIKSGDSLSTIAKRFHTDVKAIKTANNLTGNRIRIGKALLIPTATKSAEHYALSAEQRLHRMQTRSRNGKQIFYTVKSGDSFWKIAKQHKLRSKDIARWNNMSPNDTLRKGQKLSLWLKSKKHTGSTNPVRKIGYRVRSGDSLARIADKFNLRVADIVDWNSLDRKAYLQPGQALTLYVDVRNAYL